MCVCVHKIKLYIKHTSVFLRGCVGVCVDVCVCCSPVLVVALALTVVIFIVNKTNLAIL